MGFVSFPSLAHVGRSLNYFIFFFLRGDLAAPGSSGKARWELQEEVPGCCSAVWAAARRLWGPWPRRAAGLAHFGEGWGAAAGQRCPQISGDSWDPALGHWPPLEHRGIEINSKYLENKQKNPHIEQIYS